LQGSYSIVSSAGYIAAIDFSGKGLLGLGGKKNHVEAAIYRADDTSRKERLFHAVGSWSEKFEITDHAGTLITTYDVASAKPSPFRTLPLNEQDPWESRAAWDGVIKSIQKGDMQGVADNKSALENAQRELRKRPETDEKTWKALFFTKADNPVAERLLKQIGQDVSPEKTCGVWRFNAKAFSEAKRPWRGNLTPHGTNPA
jgi:hypothetical protein